MFPALARYLPLYLSDTGRVEALSTDEPLEQKAHLGSETILGLVMAHEVGHLLLGSHSHSTSGIILASWQRQELTAAGKGALAENSRS
jgi:hypothetical protein